MLKKMLAGASAIVLGMVVASDAMAECDGIYLGIRGGVEIGRASCRERV